MFISGNPAQDKGFVSSAVKGGEGRGGRGGGGGCGLRNKKLKLNVCVSRLRGGGERGAGRQAGWGGGGEG